MLLILQPHSSATYNSLSMCKRGFAWWRHRERRNRIDRYAARQSFGHQRDPEKRGRMRRWAVDGTLYRTVWLMLLGTLLCGVLPRRAHADPLVPIRTIAFAGAPVQVLVDAPSGYVAVFSGTPDAFVRFPGFSTLTLLNGRTGAKLRVLRAGTGLTFEPLAAMDGSGRVYINTVRIANPASVRVQQLTSAGTVQAAGFSLPPARFGPVGVDPQIDRVVMGGPADQSLEGYDLRTGKLLYTLKVPVITFRLDPAAHAAFVLSTTSLITLDTRTGRIRTRTPIYPSYDMVFGSSVQRVVTFGMQSRHSNVVQHYDVVQVIDTQTGRVVQTVRVSPPFSPTELTSGPGAVTAATPLAIDPGADLAIAITIGQLGQQAVAGVAHLIQLSTGKVVRTVSLDLYPYAVAVDTRLHRAYIANYGSQDVSVIDLRSGTLVAQVPTPVTPQVGFGPVSVAIDERNQTVFVDSAVQAAPTPNSMVTVFDTRIGGPKN